MAQTCATVLMAPVPLLAEDRYNPEGVDQSVFDGIMKAIVEDRPAYFSAFFRDFFNVDVLATASVMMPSR